MAGSSDGAGAATTAADALCSTRSRSEAEEALKEALSDPFGQISADALLSVFCSALRSPSRSRLCLPFPPALRASQSVPWGGDTGKLDRALKLVDDLPEVGQLSGALGSLPEVSLRVLEWLFVPCPPRRRSVFRAVPPLPELASVPGHRPVATLQYVEGVASVAQRSFSSPRRAYHGTAFDRLHSIVNVGLLNMSGTHMQKNGAIFGAGIYLSTSPEVAYCFTEPALAWKHSLLGYKLRCLLVCEVDMDLASEGEEKGRSGRPERYLVVQRPDAIRITHVVVYCDERYRAPAPHRSGGGLAHRLNWCSVLVVLYVAFMVAQGVWSSTPMRRWLRGY